MKLIVSSLLLFIMLVSCGKDISDGLTSLVKVSNEPSGGICSSGGFRIETGIDSNRNAILDSSEVQDSEYICNGNNGYTSLVNVTMEPGGGNCSAGGFKIESGIDLNNNSVLDSIEVQDREYICHGNDVILGQTQTGLKSNTIYQASSDGFLYVQYKSSSTFGNINGYIYSDKTENPTTLVGHVNFVPGSTYVPIQKNNYWKVEPVTLTVVIISWIPVVE